MINIGTRRECFFDDFLIDTQNTTSERQIHNPVPNEIVMVFDEEWEGDSSCYFSIIREKDFYRLYYIAQDSNHRDEPDRCIQRACYAESKDGINWIKPKLGLREFRGSKENNIVMDDSDLVFMDNMYFFRDENPDCDSDKKYKAIGMDLHGKCLCCFNSEDGLNFVRGDDITDMGAFDSMNIAFWDKDAKLYRCYIRGFHVKGDFEHNDEFDQYPLLISDAERSKRIRDIRYIESKDFKTWTEPVHLNFGENKPEVQLYTNCITPYPRAPHIFVGFPTRYNVRQWSPCFDNLCGLERRIYHRDNISKKTATTLTDSIFICSHNGTDFTRYDEAFMRPGAEHKINWIYGSCYPAAGFVETASTTRPDCDNELSMYCGDGNYSMVPAELTRYTLRLDGFASMHAGENEEILTTKPFVFEGSKLFANISTSAWGYMYFELFCEGKSIKSCEMFGDSVNKPICFEDDISKFSGKEVVLKIRMRDADIYSFKFE